MAIRSAGEASEVVRQFLERMGWSLFVFPRRAERADGRWVIEMIVGMKVMQFEVDDEGLIISYKTMDEPSASP